MKQSCFQVFITQPSIHSSPFLYHFSSTRELAGVSARVANTACFSGSDEFQEVFLRSVSGRGLSPDHKASSHQPKPRIMPSLCGAELIGGSVGTGDAQRA